jgi:hypothetical protein
MTVLNAPHVARTAAFGLFLSLLFSCWLALNDVGAQNCCQPPLLDPAAARLPQGAHVVVYVDMTTGFTFEEFLNIMIGIEDWNDEPNSSGVTFEVRYAQNPTLGGENTIVATYINEPAAGDGGARLNLHRDGTKIWGELKFNSRIRSGAPTFLMAALRSTSRHEMGHALGLENADTTCSEGSTIMYPSLNYETFITTCDNTIVSSQTSTYPPTPTPTPLPEPSPTPCAGEDNSCTFGSDCCPGLTCGEITSRCIPCELDPHGLKGGCVSEACANCYKQGGTYCDPDTNSCWTPILIDVEGDGFRMTGLSNGVRFDGFGNGVKIQTAWTVKDSDDAWLILDRNGNGLVDDGTELFSSAAPQSVPPFPQLKNGFNALAQFDKPEKGGNADRVIDQNDHVFSSLRLWQDLNRNGISEPSELNSLPASELAAISLDYKEARRTDGFGNTYRYRSKITDERGAQLGRWAWDVFLVAQP